MPDDASFLPVARTVLDGPPAIGRMREPCVVRTLLDTAHPDDALATGRDAPESPEDGMGLRIMFDGRWSIPQVVINGPDGEVKLSGLAEIREAHKALWVALKMAERMS